MRNLYCLCLVINFCCCIYVGDISFIYLFIHGIREGKVFDEFPRFKYYRFKRLGETLGLFVFFPLHVSHSVWKQVQTVKDG